MLERQILRSSAFMQSRVRLYAKWLRHHSTNMVEMATINLSTISTAFPSTNYFRWHWWRSGFFLAQLNGWPCIWNRWVYRGVVRTQHYKWQHTTFLLQSRLQTHPKRHAAGFNDISHNVKIYASFSRWILQTACERVGRKKTYLCHMSLQICSMKRAVIRLTNYRPVCLWLILTLVYECRVL